MAIALILSATAATSLQPPPIAARLRARATIRVLSGAIISRVSWQAQARKTERIVVLSDGRACRLYIADFE
jgi:hypothetical protein